MKVLLVSKLNSGNRYFDDLYLSLSELEIELEVSINAFWDSNDYFDIIHIQWIEALFGWDLNHFAQQELYRLKNRLEVLKSKGSKIVYTRHNSIPHNYQNHNVKELFKLVSQSSSGIIHLGEFSVKDFEMLYPELSGTCKHAIITHGNYSSLKNHLSRNEARKILNIDLNRFVILCFGTFRSKKERNLILNAFIEAKIANKTLLTNRWMVQDKNRNRIKKTTDAIYRRLLCLSKKYRLNNQFTKDDQVQYYMNAADVLVISRIDQLNSGNLYLGLTFGKVVVGPAIGNIAETIQATGNILFNPDEQGTLKKALETSLQLMESDLTYSNLKYSTDHCSWDNIAKKHLEFYNKVL